MSRLYLRLEYHGARLAGWQRQASARTVQGELESALERIAGTAARVSGASRTDAGVHARGQAAHVDLATRLSPAEIHRALCAVLPDDIAVLEVRPVGPTFHARHTAQRKRYRYRILDRRAGSPLRAGLTWHVRRRLHHAAMQAAAAALTGDHDFAAFRGSRGGALPNERTRRTLDRLSVDRDGDELHIIAEGRSFLRYMVRNLTGTLVEVGLGKRAPATMAEILASRDRSTAGPTAPPHGLCLEAVVYTAESLAPPP